MFSTKKSKFALLELINSGTVEWAGRWLACSPAMRCYVVSKHVVKSCKEPIKKRLYTPSEFIFVKKIDCLARQMLFWHTHRNCKICNFEHTSSVRVALYALWLFFSFLKWHAGRPCQENWLFWQVSRDWHTRWFRPDLDNCLWVFFFYGQSVTLLLCQFF